MMRSGVMLVVCVGVWAAAGLAQAPNNEDVARRQLDSGRAFARQGNYTEALKDFRAVADTHATTSVADDALLEIARYYIDIAGDLAQAATAVNLIVKNYATSDSAPDAYVLAGRLALARSHQSADIETAVASFERVSRLFPSSSAVPGALMLMGQSMAFAKRFEDARVSLNRVVAEFPTNAAAADAYLAAGPVLVALADPLTAMEDLQQVRNRWPDSPAAKTALDRITLLHRLYIRGRSGPAFTLSPESIGPARLQKAVALALSSQPTLYFATESGLGVLTPGGTPFPKTVARPRGLAVDRTGQLVAIDAGQLHPPTGPALTFSLPQSGGSAKALSNLQAVVQMSNGDWLVADGSERSLQRFSSSGVFIGTFGTGKFTRLAITESDDVAALDRDQKAVVVFDGVGTVMAKVPLRATGYDLENAEDLTFDAFGHLYVLDRNALGIFSP
jgi:TolA-binding protein